MIIQEIRDRMPTGAVIPKPDAKSDFMVKGWGRRRGEEALIYSIPNHKTPIRPHQKGITLSDWEIAYNRLVQHGDLSRDWFDENMQACAAEGGCNFTSIGGIFVALGLAYHERGRYTLKDGGTTESVCRGTGIQK